MSQDAAGDFNRESAMARKRGSSRNDLINGSSGDDELLGQGGNDEIFAGAGNDFLSGGSGNDTLDGGAGNDFLDGATGDDILIGGDGDDYLSDHSGNNRFYGGAGSDYIESFGATSATVDAGAGANYVYLNSVPIVSLTSGNDDDNIQVFAATSTVVNAGGGNDQIQVQHTPENGSISIAAGAGNDIISVEGRGSIDAGSGNDSIYATSSNGQQTVTTGAGADRVFVTHLSITPLVITDFAAGANGDVLSIAQLLGFGVTGWDQSSNPFGQGFMRVAQSGTDTLLQYDADGVAGGASYTTLAVLKNVNAAVLRGANFDPGYDPTGAAPPAQTITGTVGDDTLEGGLGNDTIGGLGGADYLRGNQGDDGLDGGAGDDVLFGGAGNDTLTGGAGSDQLFDEGGRNRFFGGDGNDLIHAGSGESAFVDAGNGQNSVSLYQIASADVRSGLDDDNITVYHSASAVIDSGAGADRIYASGGTIRVTAGDGNDEITANGTANVNAGTGNDLITLTLGNTAQTVTTGAGADAIVVDGLGTGAMTFTDFTPGTGGDVLNYSGVLSYLSGWNGSSNPFGTGFMRLRASGSDSIIDIDADGAANGANYAPTFIFKNVSTTSLTIAHLVPGFDPNGALGITVTGTAGSDSLADGVGDDTLYGLGGDDYLYAGTGNDTLDGGDGNDVLQDYTGSNSFTGGAGDDTIYAYGEAATVDGGEGTNSFSVAVSGHAQITAGSGADYVTLSSASSTVNLGGGADTVYGTAFGGLHTVNTGEGGDYLYLYGNYTIDAGGGDDYVSMSGASSVNAGAGNDVINVSSSFSTQTVTTGSGADLVQLNPFNAAPAEIMDFSQAGGDRLDIRSVLGGSYWPGMDLGDFVDVRVEANSTIIAINEHGWGNFVDAAVLRNVEIHTLAALEASLLVAN
jgi:Ca2+-binding RTX toxin-like protein